MAVFPHYAIQLAWLTLHAVAGLRAELSLSVLQGHAPGMQWVQSNIHAASHKMPGFQQFVIRQVWHSILLLSGQKIDPLLSALETSSHATCQGTFSQSSQFAELLWTNPGTKSWISGHELISNYKKKKKKKVQVGNEWLNILPKSSQARKMPPPPPPPPLSALQGHATGQQWVQSSRHVQHTHCCKKNGCFSTLCSMAGTTLHTVAARAWQPPPL